MKPGRGCPHGCFGRGYILSEVSLPSPISSAAIDEAKHCRAGIQNHHFINISTEASDLFRSRAMIIMEIWKRQATRLAHVNHPVNFRMSGAGRAARRAGCERCRGVWGDPSPSPHRLAPEQSAAVSGAVTPSQLPGDNQGSPRFGPRAAEGLWQ